VSVLAALVDILRPVFHERFLAGIGASPAFHIVELNGLGAAIDPVMLQRFKTQTRSMDG
jgi:hypothetical protein